MQRGPEDRTYMINIEYIYVCQYVSLLKETYTDT